jgi:hypothetical protein
LSLYREPGAVRRRRRLIAAGVAAAVVIVAVAVVLLAGGDSGPPTEQERAASARSAATEAADRLDVLRIEYGQAVKGGRVVAPTEYTASGEHVARLDEELHGHAADLDAVDPAARRQVAATLAAIRAGIRAHVEPARLDRLIDRAGRQLAAFGAG